MRTQKPCTRVLHLLACLSPPTLVRLHLQIAIAYGALSSVSCLVGVQGDPGLLNAELWESCGQPIMSNLCLGFLIVAIFLLKLAVLETGIADIHSLMTFDVPRGLKLISLSIVLCGVIALYYQVIYQLINMNIGSHHPAPLQPTAPHPTQPCTRLRAASKWTWRWPYLYSAHSSYS